MRPDPASTGYLALLRTPGARAFSLAGLVGRLPISMLGIGTVLLVQDRRGSYALAGLVSAAFALGSAGISPLGSRLVDRLGQRRVLPVAVVVSGAGLLALLALVGTAAPGGWLLLPAAVAGAALPQVGSCVRARWHHALASAGREPEVPQAYAWESVVDEVVFVVGPLVVVLCAVVDPVLGLLAALGFGLVGTLALSAQTATEPPAHPVATTRAGSAIGSVGLRMLVLSQACVGVVFGVIEVSMVAFAQERGSSASSGWLLALVAVGSAVAGLAYGARTWSTPLPRRYLLSLLGLAAGVVPLLLAPSVLLMAPAALLAGFAISPTLIAAVGMVDALVPPRARTEGFTWLTSGLGLGVAVGAAAAGAVADTAGARPAFLVALAGALLAALTTAAAGSSTGRAAGTRKPTVLRASAG